MSRPAFGVKLIDIMPVQTAFQRSLREIRGSNRALPSTRPEPPGVAILQPEDAAARVSGWSDAGSANPGVPPQRSARVQGFAIYLTGATALRNAAAAPSAGAVGPAARGSVRRFRLARTMPMWSRRS